MKKTKDVREIKKLELDVQKWRSLFIVVGIFLMIFVILSLVFVGERDELEQQLQSCQEGTTELVDKLENCEIDYEEAKPIDTDCEMWNDYSKPSGSFGKDAVFGKVMDCGVIDEMEAFCEQQGGEFEGFGGWCIFIDEESKFVESFRIKEVNGRYYLSR